MDKTRVALLTTFVVFLAITAIPVKAVDMDMNVNGGSSVEVEFSVTDGFVGINARGIDSSFWHTGEVGQNNIFTGTGSFTGTYRVVGGNYGSLQTFINVASSSSASFDMQEQIFFNILSANHIYNVEGFFEAWASGDDGVEMNLKSIGSMYVWSEATNPYSEPPLQGQYIGKMALVWDWDESDAPQAYLWLDVSTDGSATMSNSNIWGWSISESGSATTNYAGGTRTVSATGDGYLYQEAYGEDYLTFNGATLPGGGYASLGIDFDSGITMTYQMTGN